MKTKNSIETKKGTETKYKTVDKETTDLSKLIKDLAAILSILTAISTVLFTFISMSSVWHYQFEFNYFDFSISNSELFELIYTIISVLSGIVIPLAVSHLLKIFSNKSYVKEIIRHSKTLKFFGNIQTEWIKILVEIVLNVFLTAVISIPIILLFSVLIKELLIFDIMRSYYSLVALLCCSLTLFFLAINRFKINYINVIIFAAILITFFAGILFKSNNDLTEKNKDFKILEYINLTDNQENFYVVIRESKNNFSAYECEINENTLVVYTNYHKYFDISTDYEVYRFESIDYIEKHIEYSDGKYEIVTNTYE